MKGKKERKVCFMSIKSLVSKLNNPNILLDLKVKNPPISKNKMPLTKEQIIEDLRQTYEMIELHKKAAEAASNAAKARLNIKK